MSPDRPASTYLQNTPKKTPYDLALHSLYSVRKAGRGMSRFHLPWRAFPHCLNPPGGATPSDRSQGAGGRRRVALVKNDLTCQYHTAIRSTVDNVASRIPQARPGLQLIQMWGAFCCLRSPHSLFFFLLFFSTTFLAQDLAFTYAPSTNPLSNQRPGPSFMSVPPLYPGQEAWSMLARRGRNEWKRKPSRIVSWNRTAGTGIS